MILGVTADCLKQAADGDDPPFDHEEAFDAGLALIVDGLAARLRSERPTRAAGRRP
ncbi:hypothetical protein [Dactylosporangium sp. CA-233914]|uniref:hypothetical protein n=1 Tax=Dactylosporangium sp. CA-233914 TaxID=3239934 RepID=UPI003D8A6CF3